MQTHLTITLLNLSHIHSRLRRLSQWRWRVRLETKCAVTCWSW